MHGDLAAAFGANLRAYRLRLGYSQEDFADHIGIHRTYMGVLERGERNLTLLTVERIADLIEQDPLAMLGPKPRLRMPR